MNKKQSNSHRTKQLFYTVIASVLLTGSPKTVFANTNELQAVSQTNTVKGKVVDANGEPVIGASIMVKGTTNGVISDLDGGFTLNSVSGQATLVISFVGYKTQEIPVNGKPTVAVTLTEDSELLDEVVVVGYGTAKKETLTGSIAIVGESIMKDKGALVSPLQALQGQVPGLTVTRASGAPGDENWGMSMRGAVSVNTTEPLVIVDGVALDSYRELRLINPDDIESMSFLKDASAAIYGSRAAGGVVLVVTKQAKQGKAKIEYNGSYTRKTLGLQPRLMNLDQWASGLLQAKYNDGAGEDDVWVRYAQLALANKNAYIDLSKNGNPVPGAFTDVAEFVFMDVNWSDVLWKDAGSTQHTLSASGGGDVMTYKITAGYMHDEGTLRYGENSNSRYNFRISNNVKITPKFTINSIIAYNQQNQVMPSQIGRTLSQSTPQPGLPVSTIDGKPYAWGGQTTPNWWAELGGENKLKVSDVNISETLNYQILDELSFTTVLGYNTSAATRDIVSKPISWYTYTGNVNRDDPNQANSQYEKTFARSDYYSVSSYLNYNKIFNNVHNLSTTAGYEYNLREYEHTGMIVKDIQSTLEAINGSGMITMRDNRGQRNHWAMSSIFGRINYDYQSKYLFEANARYDGSSKFQPENRWNFFYGVSGGWRISEEKFMENVTFLDDLKLRASYGQVGNQAGIDLYDGTQLYNFNSSSGAFIGNNKLSYIDTNGKLASTDRTWERIHNYNIGVDFGFLSNRLSGTAEVFWKKNSNMLLEPQIHAIIGDKAPAANIGKFEANGAEFTLNWRDKIQDVQYSIGGVFSFARNNISDIKGVSVKSLGHNATVQGYPLNSYFGLLYAGKIANEEERQKYVHNYYDGNSIGMPDMNLMRIGDHLYEDVNKDGKLDFEDYIFLGTNDPEITYSLNAAVEWKGFDLSVIFQGAANRTIFRDPGNNTWRIPYSAIWLNTTNQSIGDVWSPETPDHWFPPYSNDGTINAYNYQASTWSIEDGSYIRLKNLSIGYTFPDKLLSKMKVVSALRVYLTGADLWEYSKIKDGWDPESSRSLRESTERYPFNRTYTLGLNITF